MTSESFKEQAPAELRTYEAWWQKTYGRDPSVEEDKELVGIAKELAATDPKFAEILKDSLMKQFVESDEGLEDKGKRRWALVGALSTYGKEFGLSVD